MSRSSLDPILASARAAPRPRLLLALACALLLLSGCIQDAEMKQFKCNNPNDTQPHGNCDAPTTITGTGLVTIILVDTVGNDVLLLNTNPDRTALPVTMNGWTIVNGNTPEAVWYTFSSFTLASGAYVRIHGTVTGTDSSVDLYAAATFPWSSISPNNIATLKNGSAQVISQCQLLQSTTCWR
jgi:hypothetical protein